jgi:putative DNA methylase
MMKLRKKLIEVALPLEAINHEASWRKLKAPKGWPTSFHKWWAQRPLAAARAVIFAQMVDDPSAWPDLFPTEKAQVKERKRLFKLIEDLVQWDNTGNERVNEAARNEIWQSWRRTCALNADHPRARNLFDRNKLPALHDPFTGSGSIPLSAQWLGLETYASDLNPVAVLINKALIEVPSKFAGRCPVNPDWQMVPQAEKVLRQWKGTQGLAEDVRFYGKWMRDEAEKRVGNLYPKVEVTAEMVGERPDLKPYSGKKLTVTAWLWARTVKSPDPAFAHHEVPLTSTFMLSTKAGREAYIEPVIENGTYRFIVKSGKPKNQETALNGTKLGGRGSSFRCLLSNSPISGDYIKTEGKEGRMGSRLMAIVPDSSSGRVFLSPSLSQEDAASQAHPKWKPEGEIAKRMTGGNCTPYGLESWGDIFTNRKLVALGSFSDLVSEVRARILNDATSSDLPDDPTPFAEGGIGKQGYADSVCLYLACVLDRMVYYGSSLTSWLPKDSALRDCMPRQGLAMVWDYAECNPFGKSSGDLLTCVGVGANYLDVATPFAESHVLQCNAQSGITKNNLIISTDPPYFDNIGYADLSDFFYVWMRRTLKNVFPGLLSTLAVPKAEELIASAHRHGNSENAEVFFLHGMTQAIERLAEQSHPAFPVSIYYAFKQSESDDEQGTTSTGWETFLGAVIQAGFTITGTWPMRTERPGRLIASGTNALASSIVLVCRKRLEDAPTATRREFVQALEAELAPALRNLQEGNIAPVDLAQASIGPGMAAYTRYTKVLDAEGNELTVKPAWRALATARGTSGYLPKAISLSFFSKRYDQRQSLPPVGITRR